jgi:hypothetical protein
MTPRYYHNPPTPVSARVRCPVCHEAVYSRADIHPQCAVRQSERTKPQGAPGHAGRAATAVDQVGADVVIDPPTAERTPVSDRPPA